MDVVYVVAFLVGLVVATDACCFPHKFATDFESTIKESYGHKIREAYKLSGSVAADFENQRFELRYKHWHMNAEEVTTTLYFDFVQGEYMFQRKSTLQPEICRIYPLKGTLDKRYRCILGHKEFVPFINKKSYTFLLAEVAKMQGNYRKGQTTCHLRGKQQLAILLGQDKDVTVKAEIVDFMSKGIMIDAPCSTGRREENALAFPSMDKLSEMRGESVSAFFDLIRQIGKKEEIEVSEEPESSGGGPGSGDGQTGWMDYDDVNYDDEDYYDPKSDSYYDASADGEPGP